MAISSVSASRQAEGGGGEGDQADGDQRDAGAEEDPMLVFNLTDQVREAIQQALYKRLSQRRGVFRG